MERTITHANRSLAQDDIFLTLNSTGWYEHSNAQNALSSVGLGHEIQIAYQDDGSQAWFPKRNSWHKEDLETELLSGREAHLEKVVLVSSLSDWLSVSFGAMDDP